MASEEERPLFYGGPDPIALFRMEKMVQQLQVLEARRHSDSAMFREANDLARRTSPTANGEAPDLTANGPNGPINGGPFPRSLERQIWWAQDDLDPRRSIDAECGYPGYIAPEGYKALIDREPIAAVCNELYPEESWSGWPTVYDADRDSVVSEFEQAWADLPMLLDPEPNYYGDERGNTIYEKLLLADKLAGYGRYGAVLLQFDDDTEDLTDPVLPKKGRKLINIRPFPEHLARISMFDMAMTDGDGPNRRTNRRYGLPSRYMVYFSDPQDMSRTGINENYTARQVHWSRIVHVADMWAHPSSSQVFAIERLRPYLNPIMDIRKVRGGSAEMYWKGAFAGHHFGTHPSLGPDVDVDNEGIKDAYQEYWNSTQRLLISSGMTIDNLAPQVVDPTSQLLVQYTALAVKLRCPLRVLMGSEIGQLASGQDSVRWYKRLASRQHEFITPKLLCPFINRLINLGVLPKPVKTGYKIHWPDPSMLSPTEKADVFLKRMQAYQFYVSGGVAQVIPPIELMTKFDGMDQEEAQAVLDGLEEPFAAALQRESRAAMDDSQPEKNGQDKVRVDDSKENPLQQTVGRDSHGPLTGFSGDTQYGVSLPAP